MTATARVPAALLERLRCPACQAAVAAAGDDLACTGCDRRFPVRAGIPALVTEDSVLWSSVAAARQRDYWEAEHGHREADHPIVAGFARQRWTHLARLLPLGEVRTALDVGAGNGFSTCYAPPHIACVATDGSWRMLSRHPGAERVLCDAAALPLADQSFDLAFCWELLHHVDEPWRVLAEMRRVSRRWVVFFEPNPVNAAQFVFSLVDREHRWVLRFTPRYLRRQLARAGLELVRHQRVGLIFPNKTPPWLYPALRAMPFRVPIVGISHLVVSRIA